MRAKWYIRVLLFFYPIWTRTSEYTRSGKGLEVTTKYKVFKGKEYIYSIDQELFNLKGKTNKIARRKREKLDGKL